nr:MAG: RNA-dependent RNA polymerase [Narnaviridae sp.]
MPVNIKRDIPREARGITGLWKMYIPILYENEDYILPPRGASLLKDTFIRGRYLSNSQREKLRKKLCTHIGLSNQSALILLSRSIGEIKRIEGVIEGVIDSLLLYDRNLFLDEIPMIKGFVRNILKIGTYSLKSVVSSWKEITLFMFHQVAESKLEKLRIVQRGNPFKALLKTEVYNRLCNSSVYSKHDLEGLAHLISSRQLPAGDSQTMRLALRTFKSTVTSFHEVKPVYLKQLKACARDLGSKLSKSDYKIEKGHITISNAGSFDKSTLEGGRFADMMEDLKSFLNVIPDEDSVFGTPYGPAKDTKGVRRWATWARDSIPPEYNRFNFEKNLFGTESRTHGSGFLGLDEAIGIQVPMVAYALYRKWGNTPIPSRVLVVPEPGFKTRIVTTTKWWNNVLQQGPGAGLLNVLEKHPSAEAGLARTDQAWQFLYLMRRSTPKEGNLILSSDLKEATDAIPLQVALTLLEGFTEGLNLSHREELRLANHLISSPREFISDEWVFHSTRGVMMGEPMTKVVLTLLNLCMEHLAFTSYRLQNKDEDLHWRSFSIAGDDHIVIGPPEYLEKITRNHRIYGSMISPDKHATSKRLVMYCEKLIVFENLKYFQENNVPSINYSMENYIASPWVDSIKIRLISPWSKAVELRNEKNVAIGKGKSLGRTLQWLRREFFSKKMIHMIRDRFFQRMGPLLPSRESGVYWHLLLPENLGGLGLMVDDDAEDLVKHLPSLTKYFIKSLSDGKEINVKHIESLRAFTSNTSYRGYTLEKEDFRYADYFLKNLELTTQVVTWKDILTEFNPDKELSAMMVTKRRQKAYVLSLPEIRDKLYRPILTKSIMSGNSTPAPYNTQGFKRRYAELWDSLGWTEQPIRIEEVDIFRAIKDRPNFPYYDLRKDSSGNVSRLKLNLKRVQGDDLYKAELEIRIGSIESKPLDLASALRARAGFSD